MPIVDSKLARLAYAAGSSCRPGRGCREGVFLKIVTWTGAFPSSPDRMTKTNLFETPRFFLDVYVLEPGQAQKPHEHAGEDKIYLVVEGRGTFQVGAERAELGPGDAVLAPAGVIHGAENTGSDRLVTLAFMAPHPRPPAG